MPDPHPIVPGSWRGAAQGCLFRAVLFSQAVANLCAPDSCPLTVIQAALCFVFPTSAASCHYISFYDLKQHKPTSASPHTGFRQQVSFPIPFPLLCFTPITRRTWLPFEVPLLLGSVLTVPPRCVAAADLRGSQLGSLLQSLLIKSQRLP